MGEKFDEETIVLKGKVLRKMLRNVADFSVSNYLNLRFECEDKWNYHDAFFFAGTLGKKTGRLEFSNFFLNSGTILVINDGKEEISKV